jgi:hypothetical protein
MPAFGPISRKDLVRCLRKMGFDGPTQAASISLCLKVM